MWRSSLLIALLLAHYGGGVEFSDLKPYQPLRFQPRFQPHSQPVAEKTLPHDAKTGRKIIQIAYLTAAVTLQKGAQGLIISGAVKYAIDQINKDPTILPNHQLELVWGDMKAERILSVNLLTEMWRNGAVAFIGPEDSCDTEALLASAWNLPMISYVSIYSKRTPHSRPPSHRLFTQISD